MFFFCFLVVLFLVACVLVLVFCKKAQQGYFPAVLEVFCLFCSHKRPALKCFISSYFVFFFAFVFLFNNPFLYVFCASTTFWKTLMFLVSFFFFFLPFPFLMFACFFQTNFPNIPFFEIQFALVFGCFFFLLLLLFLFSFYMFQPFCFFVVMLALFLVFFFCFVLRFCLYYSFLFCFQSMKKKTVFPAILVFF